MQEIKLEMVRNYTHENNEAIDENGDINLESIYYQTSSSAAKEIIVKRDEYKLYHMLNDYSKQALDLSNDEALEAYIKTATKNPSPFKPDEKLSPEEIWAAYCIELAFPRALNTLSMYQSTVRMIEYQLLTELQLRDAK